MPCRRAIRLTIPSIYQLEKQIHQTQAPPEDAEQSPLLNGSVEEPDKVFTRALDHDLEKICSFYQLKEYEIYGEVDALLADEQGFEAEHEGSDHADGGRRPSMFGKIKHFKSLSFGKRRRTSTMSSKGADGIPEEDESDEEAQETSALRKISSRDMSASGNLADDMHAPVDFARRRPSTSYDDLGDQALSLLYDEGITLKKRAVSLYVSLCELRSFIQLNKTGFSKVLKKYDKTLDRKLKSSYIKEFVDPAYAFRQTTMDHLSDNIEKVETAYANVVTKGDVDTARRELRLHLREHVVWERNTVWREMIGIERKAQAANMGIRQTMLGRDNDPRNARLQGDDPEAATKVVSTPIGRYRCPKFLLSGTFYTLVAIIAIFVVLLLVPIMDEEEQQNCLALVIFVSLLWATEVSQHRQRIVKHRTDLDNRQYRYSSPLFWFHFSSSSFE